MHLANSVMYSFGPTPSPSRFVFYRPENAAGLPTEAPAQAWRPLRQDLYGVSEQTSYEVVKSH